MKYHISLNYIYKKTEIFLNIETQKQKYTVSAISWRDFANLWTSPPSLPQEVKYLAFILFLCISSFIIVP